MAAHDNRFLDHGFSDESDLDPGYDSEAAEASKGGRVSALSRPSKRRKLSHSSAEGNDRQGGLSESEQDDQDARKQPEPQEGTSNKKDTIPPPETHQDLLHQSTISTTIQPPSPNKPSKHKHTHAHKPGVIYLSSLPPHLKPSALKTLLHHRGFHPITRLFLTPASKSHSSSRRLYTEGWLEFSSRKTARLCAETLNAQPVGGKKGGYYRDDVWNMRYLTKMGWDELMAGIREERREQEIRSTEERRKVKEEAREFVQGVMRRKEVEGMKRKKRQKIGAGGDEDEAMVEGRVWRQFQVMGRGNDKVTSNATNDATNPGDSGSELKSVLGQIF